MQFDCVVNSGSIAETIELIFSRGILQNFEPEI